MLLYLHSYRGASEGERKLNKSRIISGQTTTPHSEEIITGDFFTTASTTSSLHSAQVGIEVRSLVFIRGVISELFLTTECDTNGHVKRTVKQARFILSVSLLARSSWSHNITLHFCDTRLSFYIIHRTKGRPVEGDRSAYIISESMKYYDKWWNFEYEIYVQVCCLSHI